MSALVAQLGVAVVSLVVGWAALWPIRHSLGSLTYHLASMPTGLLAWPLAGAISTLVGRPLDAMTVTAGAVVLIAVLRVVQRLTRADTEATVRNLTPASFFIALATLVASGVAFTAAGITAVNNDSVVSFWPLGVVLQRTGAFSDSLMAVRAPLLTSMNAGHVLFGAEWGYAMYPLFAVNLILYLAASLLAGPLAGRSRMVRTVVTGAIALFLLTDPTFLFQTVFAHSHMITALYLLLALGELWMAAPPGREVPGRPVSLAHVVVAGTCAAGVALARPDGLAYAFIPIVFAIALVTRDGWNPRSTVAFFAPLLFIVLVPYASAYLTLGFWGDGKLTGRRAAVVLLPFCLTAFAPWLITKLDSKLPFRVSGDRFVRLGVAAGAAMLVLAHIVRWSTAKLSAMNAAVNLFGGAGGYGYLWYAIVVLLVVSIVTKDALRPASWTRPAFLAILLYFITLTLVHGVAHPGRIGAGDTLTRMTFQAIPLVAWYAGAIAARIFAPVFGGTQSAGAAADDAGAQVTSAG